MKEDYEKIKKTVKWLKEEYNFRGPLHFTDFSNLQSIISIGYLLSRSLCNANNMEFYDCLEKNSVNLSSIVNGCTRFYYVEKNNDLIKKLNIPVYLLFHKDIIYLDLSMYTDGKPELPTTNYGTDFNFFNYEIDWEGVFNKKSINELYFGPIKEAIMSKKQSELLVDEPVPLNQLKNIIFRCNADYKRACNLFGKNKMFLVEPHMFDFYNNYIEDYSIIYNGSIDLSVFILHFSTKEPVKNGQNHEYRLYDLNDNLMSTVKVSFLESNNTDFHLEVQVPSVPVKFKLWFNGVLCIEEIIG